MEMLQLQSNKTKLLVALLLNNVSDYIFTDIAIRAGAEELNPVIDLTIGTIWFPIVKLGFIPFLLLWVYFKDFSKGTYRFLYSVCFIYFLVIVWHLYGWFFILWG